MESRLEGFEPIEKHGRVQRVAGMLVESQGPDVSVGDICELKSNRKKETTMAEVVGFRDENVLLMPLTDMGDIHPGCLTVHSPGGSQVPCGMGLLGRGDRRPRETDRWQGPASC